MQICSFVGRLPAFTLEKRLQALVRAKAHPDTQVWDKHLWDYEGNINTKAYNLIANEYNKHLEEAKKAISMIYLYGTPEEIKIAQEIVSHFDIRDKPTGDTVVVDGLLAELRAALRIELGLMPIAGSIKNLSLDISLPREDVEAHPKPQKMGDKAS
jgi:hypothetical protein